MAVPLLFMCCWQGFNDIFVDGILTFCPVPVTPPQMPPYPGQSAKSFLYHSDSIESSDGMWIYAS